MNNKIKIVAIIGFTFAFLNIAQAQSLVPLASTDVNDEIGVQQLYAREIHVKKVEKIFKKYGFNSQSKLTAKDIKKFSKSELEILKYNLNELNDIKDYIKELQDKAWNKNKAFFNALMGHKVETVTFGTHTEDFDARDFYGLTGKKAIPLTPEEEKNMYKKLDAKIKKMQNKKSESGIFDIFK